MSTASQAGCTERAPTRATEIVRLELAKLSIELGVSLSDIANYACEQTAKTLNIARVGVWSLVNQGSALKCIKLYESVSPIAPMS